MYYIPTAATPASLRPALPPRFFARRSITSPTFTPHAAASGAANMRITRGFSLTNFIIATSALTFQVFVLYPWHQRLDDDFTELKADHLRYLKEGEQKRLSELKGIRQELAELKAKRAWW